MPRIILLNIHTKAFSCAALILLADLLFYRHPVGFTLGLFGLAMLAAITLHNPSARQRLGMQGLGLLLGLTGAMVLQPTILNSVLYVFGIIALALLTRDIPMATPMRLLESVVTYLIYGWWRIVSDLSTLLRIRRRRPHTHYGRRMLRSYLLPISLSGVFVLLFSQANPIIHRWLQQIEWVYLGDVIAPLRVAFWVVVAAGSWALLRPRLMPLPTRNLVLPKLSWLDSILNPISILCSLIAFNVLFLLQNGLDLSVMLRPGFLPEGISYAQYAHQGAYPLIVTALLAGAFVLFALKPGSSSERSSLIRGLVYLWVGQNILLVGFSLSRLYHYVEEYSLTYLRLSAFIWMGLVACGLWLMVARIYGKKSGAWLIRQNFVLAGAVLYVCSFIPMGSIIAQFNVRHCQEIRQGGPLLDIAYLGEIGPEALPALQWYINQVPTNAVQFQAAHSVAQALKQEMITQNTDWRSWTLLQTWLIDADAHAKQTLPAYEPIGPANAWRIQSR